MRVQITDIHPKSIWGKEIINKVFEIKNRPTKYINDWFFIKPNDESFENNYVLCKYIEVPEPSAMSELGKWIDEAKNAGLDVSTYKYDFNTPKKLSWIQKIRGYDDMRARCNSAEAMRDYYKESLDSWESVAISKARELELMEKVADNWQAKLVEANRRNDNLQIAAGVFTKELNRYGRRLKFSVGHNHITITIGNPVTLCENFISNNGKLEWSISRCSRKDVYDWKQGVIHAVDNYCDEHKSAEKLRRDLRKALAKKYPEVFDVHS
jgi:hypothetical protein